MVTLIAQVEDPYREQGGKPPLAVGLFVRASIEGTTATEAFVLPRTALHDEDRVLVLDGERLRYRRVDVMRIERDRVVVSGGLKDGERICVTPLARAFDGMAVHVIGDAKSGVAGAEPDAGEGGA